MGSIQSHNNTTLEDLQPGDTVEIKRRVISHWAVYVGEGKVVHIAGFANDGIIANKISGNVLTLSGKHFKALVKIDDFWDVVGDSRAYKNNSKDRYYRPCDVDTILDRALSMVGEIWFSVYWQNCEHFASYCRYGKAISDQADNVVSVARFGIQALGILSEVLEALQPLALLLD